MVYTMSTEMNIFKLEAPKLYRCNVHLYNSNLSQLHIRVFRGLNTTPNFYLLFTDVGYFEGPMNWQNADFTRESGEACLALMLQTGMVQNINLDDPDTRQALAEAAFLYTVKTSTTTIRIIAGSAVRLTELAKDEDDLT